MFMVLQADLIARTPLYYTRAHLNIIVLIYFEFFYCLLVKIVSDFYVFYFKYQDTFPKLNTTMADPMLRHQEVQ